MAKRVQARKKGVKGYVNAMRPAWLGNPFPLSKYKLDVSLEYYERWLRRTLLLSEAGKDYTEKKYENFAKRFDQLWGKDIGCTCSRNGPCHVDIIIKILNERRKPKHATSKGFGVLVG